MKPIFEVTKVKQLNLVPEVYSWGCGISWQARESIYLFVGVGWLGHVHGKVLFHGKICKETLPCEC